MRFLKATAAGDMKPYALKTTDYGKTWKSIISDDIDPKAFVRNIQEDYENEDLLFLGNGIRTYILLLTAEKTGRNSPTICRPLPFILLILQKRTNDLVMGTHGRGVIIIDDISPVRELTPEILNEECSFF